MHQVSIMYTLKKFLGQHFLRDENICQKIVASLTVEEGMQLLEIGPGAGALTKHLLSLPRIHFMAVEVDSEKVQYLQRTYPAMQGKLIQQDFLEIDVPFNGAFSVIGNFPYNISSQILFKILEWKEQVPEVVGMFQKEVAARIAASHGNKDYGILSVLVQAFYEVDYLFEVSKHCFDPPPKVKSAVIRLHRKQPPPDLVDEAAFFRLVKTAFNQRRKILRNPLKNMFDKNILQEEIFSKRAEELSVPEFIELLKMIK